MTLWMWWLLGAVIVLGIIGPLVLTLTPTKAERDAAKPIQLSAQQVMRNTRADLPAEYREWFDWTAEIAGFGNVKPPKMIDYSLTRMTGFDTVTVRDMRGNVIGREYHWDRRRPEAPTKPKPPQIEIKDGQVVDNPDGGIRPHGICSYGPGVGWEEDWVEGHHVWIRRQA